MRMSSRHQNHQHRLRCPLTHHAPCAVVPFRTLTGRSPLDRCVKGWTNHEFTLLCVSFSSHETDYARVCRIYNWCWPGKPPHKPTPQCLALLRLMFESTRAKNTSLHLPLTCFLRVYTRLRKLQEAGLSLRDGPSLKMSAAWLLPMTWPHNGTVSPRLTPPRAPGRCGRKRMRTAWFLSGWRKRWKPERVRHKFLFLSFFVSVHLQFLIKVHTITVFWYNCWIFLYKLYCCAWAWYLKTLSLYWLIHSVLHFVCLCIVCCITMMSALCNRDVIFLFKLRHMAGKLYKSREPEANQKRWCFNAWFMSNGPFEWPWCYALFCYFWNS